MSVLVSVIIPSYNCGKYIGATIDSVIGQTITDWEIQIVDDCSTDNTEEVLKPFLRKYSNIHFHRLAENHGPAFARTEAIRRAAGKYCAFLDSDDLWMPEKLEKQIAYMTKNKVMFCCTAYRQIDVNGNDLKTVVVPPPRISYNKCIRLSNPIGNLTVMYDQEFFGKLEVPEIKKRNDFALWLKMLKSVDYCYGMEDVLGKYRKGRLESVSFNKLGQAKYHWELYHNIEKHNAVRCLYELGCWAFVKSTGMGLDKRKVQ